MRGKGCKSREGQRSDQMNDRDAVAGVERKLAENQEDESRGSQGKSRGDKNNNRVNIERKRAGEMGDYREVKPDTRKRLIAAHVSLGEYREGGRSGRGCSKDTVQAPRLGFGDNTTRVNR